MFCWLTGGPDQRRNQTVCRKPFCLVALLFCGQGLLAAGEGPRVREEARD
jgi:hypothetical protein